jgi:hypothetical protein
MTKKKPKPTLMFPNQRKTEEPVGKVTSKILSIPLSVEEIAARKGELADVSVELAAIERKLREMHRDLAPRQKELRKARNRLNEIVETKSESRAVECLEVKNFAKQTVAYVYQGKALLERPMEEDDRQLDMGVQGV